MRETYTNEESLILGIIALFIETIAFWTLGWLSFIGLIFGIIGCCQYTSSTGWKVPAIISIPLGIIDAIAWIVGVATLAAH